MRYAAIVILIVVTGVICIALYDTALTVETCERIGSITHTSLSGRHFELTCREVSK